MKSFKWSLISCHSTIDTIFYLLQRINLKWASIHEIPPNQVLSGHSSQLGEKHSEFLDFCIPNFAGLYCLLYSSMATIFFLLHLNHSEKNKKHGSLELMSLYFQPSTSLTYSLFYK